jgi:MFS family permease
MAANGGATLLVVIRVLQGLAEGVSYPAAHALVSWGPFASLYLESNTDTVWTAYDS